MRFRATKSRWGSQDRGKRPGLAESTSRLTFRLECSNARRRRFDILVCWRLDRLGRSLRHLILLLEELEALGVSFVSLAEGIDATTPAGRLQMHTLGAIAEFERARIAERVRLGLARVLAQGKRLGRSRVEIAEDKIASTAGLSIRQAAKRLGVSPATLYRRVSQKPAGRGTEVSPRIVGV